MHRRASGEALITAAQQTHTCKEQKVKSDHPHGDIFLGSKQIPSNHFLSFLFG